MSSRMGGSRAGEEGWRRDGGEEMVGGGMGGGDKWGLKKANKADRGGREDN